MSTPHVASAVTGDVLVVDDTVANLKLLADILGRAGHRVRLAGDGELALRSVHARRPDLVLLDIRMPGMDGFEVCRRLKADAATRDITVMFLSSLTDTEEKTRAFALGAVDYLPKPVAAEEVLARVGTHLALSAAREHLEATVAERTAALMAETEERRKAEERERHVNRLLRAIRSVNQLIVREKDPARLIQGACDLLVENRGYRAVWIAQVTERTAPLLLCQSGWGEPFQAFSARLRDGHEPPCWVTARASARGLALIDPGNTCQECPLWRSYGQDVAAVVPIRHGGRLLGMFGVSVVPGAAIDDEEVSLLLEVAGDLGLALHSIQAERRRDIFAQIVSVSPDAIALIDRDYVYLEANPSYVRLAGLEEKAILGHHVAEVVGESFFASVKQHVDLSFQGETVLSETSRDIPGIGLRFAEAQYSPCRAPDDSVVAAVVSLRDVTARKQAEVRAARVSERLALATRAAHLGIWDWDVVNDQLVWDDGMYGLYGVDKEDFGGAYGAWLQGIHPDDRARVEDESRQALTGHREYESEFRVVWPDGTVRELRALGAVLRDEAGDPVRMIGVNYDVTELEHAAEALRNSEARFRTLFEKSRDALMTIEPPSWRFTAANPATIAMFGARDEAQFISWAPYELSPEHQPDGRVSREKAKEMMQTALRSGSHCFEWTHQRLSGEPFPASVLLTRMDVETQTMLQATIRDETERKRAEAQRELLTTAIEQSTDVVLITDAAGAVVYANPAFEATTGYTRAEVLGQTPPLLRSDTQDEAVYRAVWDTLHNGRTWHGRFINRKKDDTRFTEDATVFPVFDATRGLSSYVVVARDLSRELDLQAQLLQSQKMEGIGRLAGGVAHDFNNLLSVILSYAGFALEAVPEGEPLRDELLEIRKAGQRAASLTRQLLAFSRKQVLQPESLDLNRVLTNIEKMLRRIIGEDIELVRSPAADLGLVRADPGQIEQVIMNLAVNARDAMPEGGTLSIETANVELDATHAARHEGVDPGPYVMLAVRDSGSGMDEHTLARIFEPFFTTKGAGKGTGLGLSTVFGVVKQSGGSIEVDSELGKGTTFRIYLPRELSATAPTESRPARALARTVGTETILVVEDEEVLRKIARRTLEAAGYTVLTAPNGEEALATSARRAGAIDLLLTDVVMPQMSGRVLAGELLRQRPTLKVLYVSGYTDNAIVHHGVLEPGTHFLAKPFTADELERKVREVLTVDTIVAADDRVSRPTTDEGTAGRGVDSKTLRALPRDLLHKLRSAVTAARYDDIIVLIDAIERAEPGVAAVLREMVVRFDYAAIAGLLRE